MTAVIKIEERSCLYCAWDQPEFALEPCEAQGPQGFYCTREHGHRGPHVACSVRCMTEVWHDEPKV